MKKEFLRLILYVIVSISSFLVYLLYGSLSFLVLSLIFLPAAIIDMYSIKKLNFKVLLSSLLGALVIQGIGILYIYLNKLPYLTDANDYIVLYGFLGCFISTLYLFVYFYYKGDILRNKN